MKIMWSDDPSAPAAYREAIAKAGQARALLVVERGEATDAEVSQAIQDFLRVGLFEPLMNDNRIVAWDSTPRPRSPLRIYIE